jgi:hypothetical protein
MYNLTIIAIIIVVVAVAAAVHNAVSKYIPMQMCSICRIIHIFVARGWMIKFKKLNS